jgi:hypothetical protein
VLNGAAVNSKDAQLAHALEQISAFFGLAAPKGPAAAAAGHPAGKGPRKALLPPARTITAKVARTLVRRRRVRCPGRGPGSSGAP